MLMVGSSCANRNGSSSRPDQRSLSRAKPYAAGAASTTVSRVAPTLMIPLLPRDRIICAFPNTAVTYDVKSNDVGNQVGGLVNSWPAGFTEVVTIQYSGKM